MDPVLLALLQQAGLDPSAATDEGVQSFLDAMSDDAYSGLSAKCSALGIKLAAKKGLAAAPGDSDDVAGLSSDPGHQGMANSAGSPDAKGVKPVGVAPMSARSTNANLVNIEAQRVSQIKQLAATYGLGEEHALAHIASGADVSSARVALLSAVAAKNKPISGMASVSVGEDRNVASLSAGLCDALLSRGPNPIKNPHERSREFKGRRLTGMARAYLAASGVKGVDAMGDIDVAQLCFNEPRVAALSGRAWLGGGGLSTGDFPGVLLDAINKRLRTAYVETPQTWNLWCRRNTNPDFKNVNVIALSEAPNLVNVPAGGEYKDGSFNDSKETYVLQKYGRIIDINWETIINDDMSAFDRIPTAMGQAAKRLEDDLLYYSVLSNPNLNQNGNAVFSTANSNVYTSSTNVATAALNPAKALFRKQTGLNGAILNLEPKNLLAPPDIEASVDQIIRSGFDPVANVYQAFNPWSNLKKIIEPRLSLGVTLNSGQPNALTVAGSQTRWYLTGDYGQVDTWEVCFLEGQPEPVVLSDEMFRKDGRSYKVRHTVAVAPIDYRNMVRVG